MTRPELNAIIARLTHMTHGKIGRDWRSGRAFVVADKGDEFWALRDALAALQFARNELDSRDAL